MSFYTYLKTEHNYTDYQIKLVHYVVKSLMSELTKFIIMGIFFLFFSAFPEYLWCTFVLAFLRRYSGGLHFNSYVSCLLVTVSYLFCCIMLLPFTAPPRLVQLLLLILAIIVTYKVAPVPSCYHGKLTSRQDLWYRTLVLTFMFLYFIALFIIPANPYLSCGFWVIIIHSIQPLIAYTKGVYSCHS